MIRAGVDDMQMARAVGIPVSRLFTIVFCLGAALAGAGGVIGGPILSAYPGLDADMLPLALIVVILGGVGSLLGAFVGSFIIGFDLHLRHRAAARPRLRDPVPADDLRDRVPAARPVRAAERVMRGTRAAGSPRASCSLALPLVARRVLRQPREPDPHRRDLRREPQPAGRLRRPAVARPRRLPRLAAYVSAWLYLQARASATGSPRRSRSSHDADGRCFSAWSRCARPGSAS